MSRVRLLSEPEEDARWMGKALELARLAAALDEVPVGALVVCQGELLGWGYNSPVSRTDPSAHAEILALRAAARARANYRLVDCDLYVTLEPCCMCAGALVHSRIKRLVYGASEPRAGAVASRARVLEQEGLNHRVQVVSGVLAQDCSQLLSDFFRRRRQQGKRWKVPSG